MPGCVCDCGHASSQPDCMSFDFHKLWAGRLECCLRPRSCGTRLQQTLACIGSSTPLLPPFVPAALDPSRGGYGTQAWWRALRCCSGVAVVIAAGLHGCPRRDRGLQQAPSLPPCASADRKHALHRRVGSKSCSVGGGRYCRLDVFCAGAPSTPHARRSCDTRAAVSTGGF